MSSFDKLKIPLQEISSATNKFAKANIIGKGGYGEVYLGQSKEHGMLAIKRLNCMHGQGDHEYGMEVTLLSRYKHENLVSLIGFCGEGGEKILVYKYEANQSLDKHLDSKDLSWMRRLHICLEAACGLRYFHNETGCGHGVIHRDIKSSNILLDENWNAKISDFGLSKIALTNSADSVIFTVACGTPGYIDPQILYGCGITQKSDVYSFGVVLYEVLFGKLVAVPGYLGDGRFTVKMAKKHYEEKTLHQMIDPDLRNEMNSDSLSTFSTIAYQCLKERTEDRPTMRLVVEELEKALGYQQGNTRESFGLSSSVFLYDVYISFRVQDEFNRRFTYFLIEALEREGLAPYKDSMGVYDAYEESILLPAIKQSRAFIIVFSKNFAASSWNLDEVAEIVKCVKERENVVIPVFGDVHPSEVREQKGYFGEAMSKHDSNPRRGVWRNALVEVADVPGLEASNFR
ncbi:hypothetical protein L1987_60577 [Smallanthus sonchifolius]|uniref:Uncharacterized protein n=1 Tax=Smallanthus sonchifolius TaxID=185202 RepID=A0ACB9D8E6_9ASTR|nr:hypothetical protein L1987_60577 [Smallanthus sonchifolius]